MEFLFGIPIAFWGFLVGSLVWSRAARWITSLWSGIKAHRSNPEVTTTLSLVALALLHSGPWLSVATIALACVIFSRPHSDLWMWFFGGMLSTPFILVATFIVIRRRVRRRRSASLDQS